MLSDWIIRMFVWAIVSLVTWLASIWAFFAYAQGDGRSYLWLGIFWVLCSIILVMIIPQSEARKDSLPD